MKILGILSILLGAIIGTICFKKLIRDKVEDNIPFYIAGGGIAGMSILFGFVAILILE